VDLKEEVELLEEDEEKRRGRGRDGEGGVLGGEGVSSVKRDVDMLRLFCLKGRDDRYIQIWDEVARNLPCPITQDLPSQKDALSNVERRCSFSVKSSFSQRERERSLMNKMQFNS